MRAILTAVLLVSVLCAGCESASDEEARAETGDEAVKQEPTKQQKEQGEPVEHERFAADLYGRLAEEKGNLFFSPYSVSSALTMTWAGARGETADQMAEVLHLGSDREEVHEAFADLTEQVEKACTDEACRLTVANALWGQEGYEFLDGFLRTVRQHYEAGLFNVDYRRRAGAARERINAWVAEQTQDKIQDLIPRGALDRMTRLVLTNAIYFKGKWAEPFDEKETREEDFHLSADESVRVPMMHQTAPFVYAEFDGGKLLDLPYGEGDLSMVVLLPEKVGGLAKLEESLAAGKLKEWMRGARKRRVKVALPRFEVTARFQLNAVLRDMGMEDAFRAGEADFSGMNGRRDLFLSAVLHKAYVEVNEEGTEAAAATGVVVGVTAVQPQPPEFRADRPFVFLIRHRQTGTVLFAGRVADPS
ncbi:MAG: serpin family protein [Planctomycetota bacterium]